MTLSVQTGERMRELGVTDIGELSNYVPGLKIQEQSANNPGFVIRGITSDNGSSQQGARVTLYYNGVDISRSRGAYQDLFDLYADRSREGSAGDPVRHRGCGRRDQPRLGQGRSPASRARSTATYGNFDRTQVSGFLNAGNDVLAGRIAFANRISQARRATSTRTSGVDQDDLNGQDQRGIRGSLRYRPSDSITADLVLTYDGQRNPGTAFKSRATAPTGADRRLWLRRTLAARRTARRVLGARKLGLDRNVYDANLTITADLSPGVTFTTVNGYRKFDALEVFDADGGPAWYLEFAEDAKGDQWSHESRFAYSDDQLARLCSGGTTSSRISSQYVPFSSEVGTYLQCTAGMIPGLRLASRRTTPSRPRCATGLLTGGAFDHGAVSACRERGPQPDLVDVRRCQLETGSGAGSDRRRPRADREAPLGLCHRPARRAGLWRPAPAVSSIPTACRSRRTFLRRRAAARERTVSLSPRSTFTRRFRKAVARRWCSCRPPPAAWPGG